MIFLRHTDCSYFLSYWLQKSPDKVAIVAIERNPRLGAFDERDECLLRTEHGIRRALRIRNREAELVSPLTTGRDPHITAQR